MFQYLITHVDRQRKFVVFRVQLTKDYELKIYVFAPALSLFSRALVRQTEIPAVNEFAVAKKGEIKTCFVWGENEKPTNGTCTHPTTIRDIFERK